MKVKGSWKYLYRAVDKAGATVDFLLTAKRDPKAALRFLRKAIGQHGVPKKITIDKSGANTTAIESSNAEHEADIIEIRQNKNIVEQDHRAVKRVSPTMLGSKTFRSAMATLAGVELMHMSRKGQLRATGKLRPAQQFYSLAVIRRSRPHLGHIQNLRQNRSIRRRRQLLQGLLQIDHVHHDT